jgi:hypothetical protein
MLIGYKRGQGSIVLRVKILNSSVATGAGLTGLTSASSGLIISTIADNEATATAYTVAASNVETITTLGTYAAPSSGKCRFKEVDATNHKGVYEIQIADARFAVSSAKSLLVSVSGATNAAETDVVIPLRDLDPFDAVRAGLTALPNAAAEASGGLITRGTGTGQLTVSSGVVTANTTQLAGQTVTAAAGVTFPTSVSSLTAAGVRTELTTELGRIDVAVSSRLATSGYTTPPTAAANASAVRTELSTELGRIDVATSTRLATSGYTAPLDAAGTRSALGMATANLDTQLDALPTAVENAGAVWNALIASYTVTGSFGQRILRSTNTQAEVAVTGSSHVAADIHESQPGSIHATTFDAGAIDAAALASDAATEIATATLTTAMTESYRAAGVAPTLAQAAFELIAHMGDSSISDQTKTLKKLDGTTAKTFTLNSSTTPTSITEAT